MSTGTTGYTDVLGQAVSLVLKDVKAALKPDLIALVTYIAQNGITIAGLPQLLKFGAAVEADAIAGGQQAVKDVANLVVAWLNAAA